MRKMSRHGGSALCLITVITSAAAQPAAGDTATESPAHAPLVKTEIVRPYEGPAVKGVDTSTLRGKVMCGYQGWFAMPADGSELGVVHWGDVQGTPPRASVDLWPDMSELGPMERFPTNFRHADGSTAYVFSSVVKPTVLRHFRWMQEYGIDGVFVQRFLGQTGDNPRGMRTNAVLSHCREGANRYGRSFAVMYDTGFDRDAVDRLKTDWRELVEEMDILGTPAYQRHEGKPVVALWGYGFEHRAFDKEACEELFRFFQAPENGGCTIMLGIPNDWRSWADGDERAKGLMELLETYADIVQPWNVGRYGSPEEAKAHFATYVPKDLAWCEARGKDYYAVIFPGFSWSNLRKGMSPLNQIPRLGGRFFWSQAELVKRYRMDMAYVAMFDEVDEGTAIFKCTNRPPVGRFVTHEGLPGDHYLNLAGLTGRMLRGEEVSFPDTEPDPAQMAYQPVGLRKYYQGEIAFEAEAAERLGQMYRDIPVAVVGTGATASVWMYALTDELFDLSDLSWTAVLKMGRLDPARYPLVVFGEGSEGFGFDGEIRSLDRIVSILEAYVRNGGTLLLLSGGRYPMYRPGNGSHARQIGLQVGFLPSDEKYAVHFSDELPGNVGRWEASQSISARVPVRTLYPHDVRYQQLALITDAAGQHVGDAIAAIGPGGPLGRGRILYVANDLQRHPQQAAVLGNVLEYVANEITK